MWRCYFFLFWFVCLLLLFLRIVFDVNVYLNGATIRYEVMPSGDFRYLLHLPPGYHDFKSPSSLIVYLHGAGETGKGLNVLKNRDLWHYAKGKIPQEEFPFIVVCPQSGDFGWSPEEVIRFTENFIQDSTRRFRIDSHRIYLTGVSMGGIATFHITSKYPNQFAAIVPVCGGGKVEQAENLINVPIWAFHGNTDDVIPFEYTSGIVDAIRKQGGTQCKFTLLYGMGHAIAEEVYTRRDLYQWLLLQRKENL